jgi:hypothetical protein
MITWNRDELLAINMRALIAEHGDCGSDAKGCAVCDIIETDRIVLATDADRRVAAEVQRGPSRDHEYDGRGR